MKFDSVLPLLVQLLDKLDSVPSPSLSSSTKALSPFEYLTLKSCISVFEPKMAAHLQTNHDAFQLLIKLIGTHSFGKLDVGIATPQELAINQVLSNCATTT